MRLRAAITEGYWGDVIRVSGGTVLAQSVSVVGYVVIGNVYGASAFGTFASWFSIAAIVGVLSTGALETSLVLDADGDERRQATARTIVTTAIAASSALLLLVPVWLLAPSFLQDFGVLGTALIAIGGFLQGSNTTLQSWASASGHFTDLNRSRLVQSTSTTVLPIVFGLVRSTPQSLILGYALGLVITVLYWRSRFRPTRDVLPSMGQLTGYWKYRSRYFFFVLPALGIGAVTINLPVLVVRSRFGVELAGILALTVRVLGAPSALVGVAVRDVFRRHASVAFRERGECRREYLGSFSVLGALSAVSAIVVVAFSETFFRVLFGDEWIQSGTVAVWLLPVFALGVVASPLSYVIYIAQREQYDLVWQAILLVVVSTSLLVAPTFRSALLAYSFGYSTMYLAYLLLGYRLSLGNNPPVSHGRVLRKARR